MDKKTRNAVNRAIRNCFKQSDFYKHVKNSKLSLERGVRNGKRWDCEHCKNSSNKVEIDHIEPVVPLDKFSYEMTVEEYYNRVFNCPLSNLQVLCIDCHNVKSKKENELRRKYTHKEKIEPIKLREMYLKT